MATKKSQKDPRKEKFNARKEALGFIIFNVLFFGAWKSFSAVAGYLPEMMEMAARNINVTELQAKNSDNANVFGDTSTNHSKPSDFIAEATEVFRLDSHFNPEMEEPSENEPSSAEELGIETDSTFEKEELPANETELLEQIDLVDIPFAYFHYYDATLG